MYCQYIYTSWKVRYERIIVSLVKEYTLDVWEVGNNTGPMDCSTSVFEEGYIHPFFVWQGTKYMYMYVCVTLPDYECE